MPSNARVRTDMLARRRRIVAANGGVAPIEVHNASTYANWGCHCPDCKADHAQKAAQRRESRIALTVANGGIAPVATHNRSTYLNWGCTCQTCIAANRQGVAVWKKAHRGKRS